MKKKLTRAFAFLFFFIIAMSAFSLDVPPLGKEFCHDEAGVLTTEQVAEIEGFLKDLNEKSKVQLALLTVPSLEDEVLEDYSIKVATKWKLGDKQANSGALLLIAKNDRKMRIEAGYGLEGVLTDAVSFKIIRNKIAPAFKKDDYYSGIKEGLRAISGYALQDESLIKEVEGNDKSKKNKSKQGGKSPFTHILFFIVIMIIGFLARRKGASKGVSTMTNSRFGKMSSGMGAFSAMAGAASSMLSKDDDDGPLGKGGSFGGGGASGSW